MSESSEKSRGAKRRERRRIERERREAVAETEDEAAPAGP